METLTECAALVNAAVAYAARGWRTMPVHGIVAGCCTCGSPRCEHPGKHPRLKNWPTQATTDMDIIRRWWTWWPAANVGIVTGQGLLVVDVDPRHGGDESLAALEAAHGALDTPRALTGGGGSHHFLRVERPVQNATGIRPGLDIRGENGFVVAPPSLHASGRRYTWDLSADPDEVPLQPAPRWLLALCAERQHHPAGTPDEELRLQHGERNNRLFRLACAWRRQGIGAAALRDMLSAVSAHHCVPPLGRDELERIARQAAKYAPGSEDDVATDELLARALGARG
jgi:Bifunctional DNA primase/polymerase, N-terminal/Primase C terminal 1 (PriCT-1)